MGFSKYGLRARRRVGLAVEHATRREPAVAVHGLAQMPLAPIVEQRIAGARVECQQLAIGADPCEVGNTADIDEGHRPLRQRSRQCLMIDRNQRRPLPACRHIGGPEVINHIHPQPPRQFRSIAELNRQALLRAVNDRLAVEPDNVDVTESRARLLDKPLSGLNVPLGEFALRLRKTPWPGIAAGQVPRLRNRLPKQKPLGSVIGIGAAGATLDHRLSVGSKQSHVNPVERGARHHSNGGQRF